MPKDCLGLELKVGDTVAFFEGTNHILLGEIVGFTSQLVELKKAAQYKYRWFYNDNKIVRKSMGSVLKYPGGCDGNVCD